MRERVCVREREIGKKSLEPNKQKKNNKYTAVVGAAVGLFTGLPSNLCDDEEDKDTALGDAPRRLIEIDACDFKRSKTKKVMTNNGMLYTGSVSTATKTVRIPFSPLKKDRIQHITKI